MRILKLKALGQTWEVGDTCENEDYVITLSSITKTEVENSVTMFKIYWKVSTVYNDFSTITIDKIASTELLREVVACTSYAITCDITAEANKLVGCYKQENPFAYLDDVIDEAKEQ